MFNVELWAKEIAMKKFRRSFSFVVGLLAVVMVLLIIVATE